MKEPVDKRSKDKSKPSSKTASAAGSKAVKTQKTVKAQKAVKTEKAVKAEKTVKAQKAGNPAKSSTGKPAAPAQRATRSRELAPPVKSGKKQPQTKAVAKKEVQKPAKTGIPAGKAKSPARETKVGSTKSAPVKSSPKVPPTLPAKSISSPAGKNTARPLVKEPAKASGKEPVQSKKTVKPEKSSPVKAPEKGKTVVQAAQASSSTTKRPKTKPAPTATRTVAEPVPVKPPVIKVEPTHRQPSATAVKVFEQAIRVFHKRQFAEAKELFENLLSRYPQELEILSRVATYINVCEQKLAQEETLPRRPEDLYDRGVFALNTGNYGQAKTCFEKALNVKPDEPHILYSLAATLVHLGEIDQALVHLQRSMQLQPRYRSQVLNDTDFSDLRDNRQFLSLMGMTSPFDRLDPRR